MRISTKRFSMAALAVIVAAGMNTAPIEALAATHTASGGLRRS